MVLRESLACAETQATLIAFVPPHSLAAVLDAAGEVLGQNRRCVVARELTKLHEELYRATLGDAARRYADTTVKVRHLIQRCLN